MKKIMIALAAAMMMSSAALAQDDKSQDQRGPAQFDQTEMIKRRTDDAVQKYGLNAEQAKQLLELNTKYADRMGGRGMGRPGGGRGMRRGGGEGFQGGGNFQGGGQRPELTEEQRARMEEMRKQREETRKAYDAEMEKILTPEQFKAYQEDAKNRNPFGGRGGRRGGPRPQNP
jgi:Spy/CpxP family protein refolding chaperone